MTEHSIKKKEKYFTIFLTNVLRNRHLRGGEHLYEFFTVKDEKEFKDKRKTREKKEKDPSSVYDHISGEGLADVGTSDHWKFGYQMPDFINSYTTLQNSIIDAYNDFRHCQLESQRTLLQLAQLYDRLGELYNQVGCKQMYRVNKFTGDAFTEWGNSLAEHADIIKNSLFPEDIQNQQNSNLVPIDKFHEYYTHEGESLMNLVKTRFSIKENGIKAETKLNNKKSALFKTKDIRKWELTKESMEIVARIQEDEELAKDHMLPTESKQVLDKQYLLNYYSHQVHDQVNHMVNDNYNDFGDFMVQYGKYQKGVITKSLKNWDNLIDYFENQCVREPDDDDMNLSLSTQKPAEEAKAEVDFDDLSKSTNDAKDVDNIDFGHSLEPENHSSFQNTKQPKSDINDFGAINDFDAFDDQDDYGMNGKSKVKTEKKPLVEKEIASTKQSSPSKSALEQPQEKINGGTINPPDLNVISRF